MEKNGGKKITKKELKQLLDDLEDRLKTDSMPSIHAMLVLNSILRLPDGGSQLDAKMKTRVKDIWLKLKASGLELENPPLIFGISETHPE